MNTQPTLNFARRLRPQRFSDIIGQDIFVGMLQNALFLNKFFPVYLFSGQRGCGKTTTARVFAAALNCLKRGEAPLQDIPCLTCSSCLATKAGNHPDFIEIDAASNTGVDNVRAILESSSYLPVLGKYKIYLIDEAHMLSKAAFNAFLKLMEEPPQSVLFMLATTESYKIPETVRSRCFQLLFKPIPATTLATYLKTIAASDGFSISDGALDILIEQTDGSARDALNLMEQLSILEKEITAETLSSFFGRLQHRDVMAVCEKIIMRDAAGVIELMQSIKSGMRMPQQSWMLFLSAFKAILYAHYGIASSHFDAEWLAQMKDQTDADRIIDILGTFWTEEELFLKTEYKIEFLEHTLVTLAASKTRPLLSGHYEEPSMSVSRETERQLTQAPHKITAATPRQPTTPVAAREPREPAPTPAPAATPAVQAQPTPATPVVTDQRWQAVLGSTGSLTDPLLVSLLKQTTFMGYDEGTGRLTIGLAHNTSFFKEKMNETQALWLPLVKNQFSGVTSVEFVGNPQAPKPTSQNTQSPPQPRQMAQPVTQKRMTADQEIRANPDQWPQAHLLINAFPGKIEEIGNS